jgi:hypothetical protein
VDGRRGTLRMDTFLSGMLLLFIFGMVIYLTSDM